MADEGPDFRRSAFYRRESNMSEYGFENLHI